MAGPTAGCYIDLFEEPDHGGVLRRLYGPAIYPAERRAHDHEPVASRKRSRGRGVTIESIIVGPAAYVLCFVGSDDSHRPTWLVPNQIVRSFKSARLNPAIDSFQLFDRPPTPGDPAYEIYRRQRGRG